MSFPVAFISSTCIDLYDVRRQIAEYLTSIGINPIRSDNGDIPFRKDRLDTACYDDISNCNIFILIQSGRYGSDSSCGAGISITHKEFRTATEKNIPLIFAFIKDQVDTEYRIYQKNKSNKYKPEYVDNIKIFDLVDEVYAYKCNIKTFNNTADITSYLRSQFAGFINEYINSETTRTENLVLGEKIERLHLDIISKLESHLSKPSDESNDGANLKFDIFKNSQFAIRIRHLYKVPVEKIKAVFDAVTSSNTLIACIDAVVKISGEYTSSDLDRATIEALSSIASVIGVDLGD